MKKFFKALALVLALTLIMGTIPASAAVEIKAVKSKTLYVDGTKGFAVDADGVTTAKSKYKARVTYAKLLGITKKQAKSLGVTAVSSAPELVKANDNTQAVRAYGIASDVKVTLTVDGTPYTIPFTAKKSASDGTVIFGGDITADGDVIINKEYTVTVPRIVNGEKLDTDERELTASDESVKITPIEGKPRQYTVKFTKLGEGFKLTAKAFQSTKYNGATGSNTITLNVKAPALQKVKETANNVVTLYFDDDASQLTKEDIDLYYLTATNTKIHDKVIKSVTPSKDGKEVAVEIYSTFTPKTVYKVTVGEKTEEFTAKTAGVEDIVRFEIVETQVAVGSIQTVTYKFYDADDMLITGVMPSDLVISKVSGPDTAFATGQNNVYIAKSGETMVVKAKFTKLDKNYDTIPYETPEKTIVGVDAYAAATIKMYSLTTSDDAIGTSTTANHIIKMGTSYKLHVLLEQASNLGGNAAYTDIFKNANYKIESVDETKFVVSNAAGWEITPVAEGTGVILLKDKDGNALSAFEVTVKAASYCDDFEIASYKTSLNVTSDPLSSDKVEIKITIKDQYGETLKVAGKSFTLAIKGGATKVNGSETLTASTNADGVATFTITGITADTYPSAVVFTVKTQRNGGNWADIVKNVGITAVQAGATAATYAFEASANTFDMAVTGDTKYDPTLKTAITVQLKGYKDGYFTGNSNIAKFVDKVPASAATGSAADTEYVYVVTKNGTALKDDSSADSKGFTFSNGLVTIRPFETSSTVTDSAITKMKTGTYVITAYSIEHKAGSTIVAPIASTSVTINDTQLKPSIAQAKDNVDTKLVTVAGDGKLANVDASWYTVSFNGAKISAPLIKAVYGAKDETTGNVVITKVVVGVRSKEGRFVELEATGLPIVIHNK